jgi:uncharacterized protein (DUF362 family)/Pyruvate/2-oxoacid:ferredoxin oxidoreductase delta subunit
MKTRVSITRCEGYVSEQVSKAVRQSVDLLGGMGRFVKAGQKVLLKPNLLVASTPERGVSPHPMVVKAVMELVKEAGGTPILGDSPAFGTAQRVAAKAGIAGVAEAMGCPIVDFRDTVTAQTPGEFLFRRFEVAREVVETPVVINLPKIKTHGQMLLTLAVKNMFGCVPGTAKASWHLKAGIDRMTFARMLVELYGVLKPSLTIMDGIIAMEGNGPNSGTPRPLGMVLAGTDCVAIDSTVTHVLGLERKRLWTTRAAMDAGIGVAEPDGIEVLGRSADRIAVSHFQLPEDGEVTWGLPRFLRGVLKDALLPRPVIDRDRCRACFTCVDICPPKAIRKEGGSVAINSDNCIRCFCCQEICPEGAIEIRASIVSRILGRDRGTCGG